MCVTPVVQLKIYLQVQWLVWVSKSHSCVEIQHAEAKLTPLHVLYVITKAMESVGRKTNAAIVHDSYSHVVLSSVCLCMFDFYSKPFQVPLSSSVNAPNMLCFCWRRIWLMFGARKTFSERGIGKMWDKWKWSGIDSFKNVCKCWRCFYFLWRYNM